MLKFEQFKEHNKYLLVEISKEDFESNRGKTFGTVNTEKSSFRTKYPTVRNSEGKEFYSSVSFDSYEEYLEYNKPKF